MKALILAAGKGTRLNCHTNETPKCLLKVGSKELLELQLGALHSSKIKDISIVTGHLADKVKSKAGIRAKCIFNPLYDKEGILLSFQAVKEFFYNQEFLCLAGDILFHTDILGLILNTKGDVVIGVEKKECNREDSKALIINGEIIKMGKAIQPRNANELIAEFVHMYKFSPKGSRVFFDNVEKLIKSGKTKAYMMDALNNVIKNGLKIIPSYSDGFQRIEIDFKEDLERARSMKWS